MGYEQQPTMEEINLVRLLVALEKTVENEEEWKVLEGEPVEVVELRVRKMVQIVEFARRLMKTVEIESEVTPTRSKLLNDSKIRLDRMDEFLKELRQSLESKVEKVERVSLLSMLPLPPVTEREPLTIIPPDPDELSSSVISTALPSLLPIDSSGEFGKSTGFQPLHEELSVQLEQMARQLKRNAIDFSTRLGNDKSVIEEAGMKVERNLDVLQGQRMKLRDRRGGSTCMVVVVVLAVLVVFMMMVMMIRVM